MHIAICEDDKLDCEKITSYCERYEAETGYSLEIETYNSAKHLPCDISHINLLLLDIMLDGVPVGVETARAVRASGWRGAIILVTSSKDYYPEGFEVGAVHYLVKPVAYGDFVGAMERVIHGLGITKRIVSVPVSRGQIALPESEILYVDVYDRETLLHLSNETLRVLLPLKEIEELLSSSFLRCFRSCLVNMEHIARMEDEHVVLKNKERLPLTLRNRQSLHETYMDYRFGGMREGK